MVFGHTSILYKSARVGNDHILNIVTFLCIRARIDLPFNCVRNAICNLCHFRSTSCLESEMRGDACVLCATAKMIKSVSMYRIPVEK